jgi:hypothetical protein
VRDSATLGRAMERAGFALAWASDYLRERNWIQIARMGETSKRELEQVVRELARVAR